MSDFRSEIRKRRLHEEWLSRGAYVGHFGSREPPAVFSRWGGNADPCRCGCDEVRYNRSTPLNLWRCFDPRLLWELEFLFPVFRTLYAVLWELSGPLWDMFRAGFCVKAVKDHVIADPLGNRLGRALIPLRFLFWIVFSLLLFLLAATVWSLPRLGGVVIFPLYFAGVAFLMAIMGLIMGLAALFMALYSLVFLIGGVASILYLSSPVIGILLLVAGVGIEYESRRRRDRQNREQLGRVLRIVEQKPSDRDVVAESTPWF